MQSDAIRCNRRQSEAIRCNQMQSDAIRCNRRQSDAIGGNQRQSEAIRGNQRQSEAIRCNPRQSEAIRGNQRQSEAHHAVLVLAAHGVTERVDRPCVLELPVCPRTNATSCLSNALSFWSQRRDSQRQSETRTHRAAQRQSAAISGHPRPSEAVTCNQRPSEASHQRRTSADQSGSSHWLRRGTREGLERVVARLGHRVTQREECAVPDEGGIRCHQLAIRPSGAVSCGSCGSPCLMRGGSVSGNQRAIITHKRTIENFWRHFLHDLGFVTPRRQSQHSPSQPEPP
jgi:hypothetical protein